MATGAGERNNDFTPLASKFNLDDVIVGLADDLKSLRAGDISPADAAVRAGLAKQIMNGVRLVISAQKFLEQRARLPGPAAADQAQE